MSNRPIDALLEAIDRDTKIANRALEDIHPSARAGHVVAIREAQERLVDEKKQYGAYVRKNGVALFLDGPKDAVESFVSVAKDDASVIAVDALEVYRQLAAEVYPSIGPMREFGVTQIRLLTNGVDELLQKLDLKREARQVSQDSIPYIADEAACVEHCRACVRNAFGDEIFVAYVERQVVEKALLQRYKGSVVPVLVLGGSEGDHEALEKVFAKGQTSITLDAVIEPKDVLEKLGAAQSQIRQNRAAQEKGINK